MIKLFQMVRNWAWEKQLEAIIISALLEKKEFYQKIGFACFGPLVGKNPVLYQPMYLTAENYIFKAARFFDTKTQVLNFLPGPVSQKATGSIQP